MIKNRKMAKKKPRAVPAVKGKVGRPPKFATAKLLQAKIDDYFVSGKTMREVIVGRGNTQQVVTIPTPTINGLVLYCGYADESGFYEMEKKPEFTTVIKNARTRIKQHYEELLTTSTPTGAIFWLKCHGYKDKEQEDYASLAMQILLLQNKFLLQSNKELFAILQDSQNKFIEVMLQSTSINHFELLIEKMGQKETLKIEEKK
jgi:hypothetical protein